MQPDAGGLLVGHVARQDRLKRVRELCAMVFRVFGLVALLMVAVSPAQAQSSRLGLTDHAITGRWDDFNIHERWAFSSWATRQIDSIYNLGMSSAEQIERAVDLNNCLHDLLDKGGLTVMERTHLSNVVLLCWKLTQQGPLTPANS